MSFWTFYPLGIAISLVAVYFLVGQESRKRPPEDSAQPIYQFVCALFALFTSIFWPIGWTVILCITMYRRGFKRQDSYRKLQEENGQLKEELTALKQSLERPAPTWTMKA